MVTTLLPKVGKKTVKGGMLVARMLKAEGVDTVFGIIDGTYFGLYSSFREVGIRLVTPRNEACAAHMAAAYARSTGKLGVCMASNGPGVANVLPGVAVEQAEGNRVLLITSARRTGTLNPDRGGTYQSFSQVEVTGPMCKWAVRVPSFERLGELTRRALRKSFDGRPGVVHLDVPENIFNGDVTLPEDAVWEPSAYRNTARLVPSQDQVERAAQLLIEAEKPVIHAGSGVLWADATAELDRVARLLHAPVTTSWAGRAAVKETEGYSIPLLYLDLVNQTRVESDAVLILGSRVGETDWWGKQPYWGDPHAQKTIQVDIDAETIGVNKPVVLGVQACAKTFLAALADVLERRKAEIDTETRRARIQKIQDARAKARAKLDKKLKDTGSPMGSAHVNTICQQVLGDDAIAVFDGGNTAVWGHFFHEVRTPGALLSTFKMGHLGAGTPQALGAKAAFPNRHVYCMTGDGAMGMQLQEIETAVRNRLNVIYLVLSDKQWGMVKINQQFALRPIKTLIKGTLDEHETINTDLCEIDFARAAQAMGANGERVSDPVALKAAVERAARANGPTVIHVDVDPVKHMWAPGLKAFKDMHLEPKGK